MNDSLRVRAPQLPARPELWLNTNGGALELGALNGNVVLLFFWTYSNIACLQALPDTRRLAARFADQPFLIIGVHTGKFDGEQRPDSVRAALERFDVRFPVLRDDARQVWQAYEIHAWPAFVVIDREGFCVGSVSGAGHGEELEQSIQRLLPPRGDALLARLPALKGKEGIAAPHSAAHNALHSARPSAPEPEANARPDAPLRFPGKILADARGERLYIADTGHHRLLVCGLDGSAAFAIGSGLPGYADGDFETARFAQPQGLARMGDFLFVCDRANHRLRRVDLVRRTVTTLAGTGAVALPRASGGPAGQTPLASPWDICLTTGEAAGGEALFVAMAGLHQIWRYDLRDDTILPFAGSGREARVDGDGLQAAFAQPSGIAADGPLLRVADSQSGSLRAVRTDAEGEVSTRIAGDLFAWGDADGTGDEACLQFPLGICAHGGMVYIADALNHKIRVLDPVARTVITLAGTGQPGLENGLGETAQFAEPGGLSVANGKCYIADANNHCIRVLDLQTRLVSTLELPALAAPDV